MARPHVALVVDDDADVLQEIRNMLESLGHSCCCARTQEEAERCLQKQAFCYILLDLELPVRANRIPKIQVGFNLLERIRERFSQERLPVIIMTAHGKGHEYPTRAFKMGADDYIKKPFDNECEPFEDKIRTAMKKTCEKNHADCPNLQVVKRSRKKLTSDGPQPLTTAQTGAESVSGAADRRAMVDSFIEKVLATTAKRITRTHIWRAVGHKSPRQFQYWQAGRDCTPGETHGATKADDDNFRRILSMPPEKFTALLEKKELLPTGS